MQQAHPYSLRHSGGSYRLQHKIASQSQIEPVSPRQIETTDSWKLLGSSCWIDAQALSPIKVLKEWLKQSISSSVSSILLLYMISSLLLQLSVSHHSPASGSVQSSFECRPSQGYTRWLHFLSSNWRKPPIPPLAYSILFQSDWNKPHTSCQKHLSQLFRLIPHNQYVRFYSWYHQRTSSPDHNRSMPFQLSNSLVLLRRPFCSALFRHGLNRRHRSFPLHQLFHALLRSL